MDHLGYLQALLLGLVALVVVFAGLARRFSLSYPIVLVLAGLLCSLPPQIPDVPLPPDLVFLIFLPPLLFAAAWQTSWRDFRFNLVSILMLAVGLVFFTACAVALTAPWFLPGFDWRVGFVLGAIVSPTDAVAATSIARNVGMPKRIVDLLEGESLINDATGLLALQFGVALIQPTATPGLVHSLFQFLWLLFGGAGIGLLIAAIVMWADKWFDDGPVEIVLSFLVAYLSYLAGEAAHASGVIATVACGLYMSRQSSEFFSPSVRLQAEAVWNAAEFLLNGLVFVLLGLQLPYILGGIHGYSFARLTVYGLVFSAVLIALRLLWVFPASRFAYTVRTRFLHQQYDPPTAKGNFVLGWTGMRGVVALAAAGSLPYTLENGTPFPQRNILLFLTFAVILVTLVLQGVTLPAVIRRLRFDPAQNAGREEASARQAMICAVLDSLHSGRAQAATDAQHVYDDLLHWYEHQAQQWTPHAHDAGGEQQQAQLSQKLRQDALKTQRRTLLRLHQSGEIGDTTQRALERELDIDENRLSL